MKKSLLLIFFVLTVVSCANANNLDVAKDSSAVSQEMLQAFLNDSKLNQYFHEDQLPSRIPLIILKNEFFQQTVALEKFERPVEFWEEKNIKTDHKPFLNILTISKSKKDAVLTYSYPEEGIFGDATLRLEDGRWVLISENIVER